MRKCSIVCALIIVFLVLFSCESIIRDLIVIPIYKNNYSASTDSTYAFNTDSSTVEIEYSPLFNVSRDTLGENGMPSSDAPDLFEFKPGPIWDTSVLKEFIINPDDSFRVCIKNCMLNREWDFCIEDIENFIISKDSIPETDSTYNCLYTFVSKKNCKGYIGFFEYILGRPGAISSSSPGFIIGYTVNYLSSMTIRFDEINWIYEITDKSSRLAVSLKGHSNAYKLKIETYGDGLLGCKEIIKDEYGHFNFNTGLSFRYGSSDSLKTNTRVALYGAPGDPKIIILKNPLSECCVSIQGGSRMVLQRTAQKVEEDQS